MGMLYKRGAVWWIKYYRNGRGMRESSHSTKEGDARRLLKLREGDIEHGLPVDPKLNRIRFEDAFIPGHHVRAMRALDRIVVKAVARLCGSSEARALTTSGSQLQVASSRQGRPPRR